jgi:hypothetical protein
MTLEELLQQSIDLNNEKLEIEKKRLELAEKQLELNNLIAAAKKEKELEKVQVIIIEKIQNGYITLDTNGTPRIDVLELLRATPSRNYNHVTQRNTIDIRYWNQFKESLDKLPNIELSYLEKNKEYLENYFSEKLWRVSKGDKAIIIKNAERNKDLWKLSKIPSASWNTMVKATTVPYSEGWRVIQVLPLSDEVEYTPEVLELIQKQVEQRKKMDEVALKQDADIPNTFIDGYELKPFQRAGVFFAMTALGIEIPVTEKKKEVKPW